MIPTCNKENMKKLVTALRSGKYKQVRNRYHGLNPDEYCAVGLAYKVVDDEILHRPLPRERWYGVNNLVVDLNGGLMSLIQTNDDGGYTFNQLAAGLEKYYHLHDISSDEIYNTVDIKENS